MEDKSHVGMSNCFVCLQPSCVLLDRRLQNTLTRNMGPMDVDDLCHACAERAKAGYIALVEITEEARRADEARMQRLQDENRQRSPQGRYIVVPCPERSSRIPWMRRTVLEKLIKALDEHLVGCVMFAAPGTTDEIMKAFGVTDEQVRAATEAAATAGEAVDVVTGKPTTSRKEP